MKLRGFGLDIDLPAGWTGRVYQRSPEEAVVLQAGTFPLPEADNDIGHSAQARMGEGDLYINIIDIGPAPPGIEDRDPDWEKESLPAAFAPEHLSSTFEDVALPAYGVRSIIVNGRALMIHVGFGGAVTKARLGTLNSVVRSLVVGSR